ncbi:MAG: carbohydrate-binding protein, partial [Bacteroidetes bacterium]
LSIEGNWFANDFTGLTPPWDDNMVYSPHKYWSTNDQGSIQWVLDLREAQNVPLWFGETGENSNTWFTEAIRLFAAHDIGWAWWPMKKIEDIKGPLSILKPDGYQDLLDYWNGDGPRPSVAAATSGLMDLAQAARLENCYHQPGVIDAMFRQIEEPTTRPYKDHHWPGKIYAADYDFGSHEIAYGDNDVATYHLSTGNYTAWNKGWAYRNDGVDIEPTQDPLNTLGYNVGWFDPGEWMQYTIAVDNPGVYDLTFRIATQNASTLFRLEADGAALAAPQPVASTGGWQTWQEVTLPDVVLDDPNLQLRIAIDQGGFNLSSLSAIRTGASTEVSAEFVSAVTSAADAVALSINKSLAAPLPASPAGFDILVNGSSVPILQTELDAQNPRLIHFRVDHTFLAGEVIEISYAGTQVQAQDGTSLTAFTLEEVQNTRPIFNLVPGRVEAEAYFFQVGTQLENTTDQGGGQNIGYLDPGDYLDYYIDVAEAGSYQVDFRNASDGGSGGLALQLVDSLGTSSLGSVSFTSTGGWQSWQTTSATMVLPAGLQQLRVLITDPQFNLNWMEFSRLTSLDAPHDLLDMQVYPNPSPGRFEVTATLARPQAAQVEVLNALGQLIQRHPMPITASRVALD